MNLNEYISSGIVESYVLGLASAEERAEFERMCASHRELIEARTNFELSIEKQAFQNAVPPPFESKEKVWSAIKQSSPTLRSKVVDMQPQRARSYGLRWFAAASVVFFLAAALLAYFLYNKNRDLRTKIARSDTMINELQSKIDEMARGEKIMHDPDMMVVNMVGLKGSSSSANVYWDSTSTDVYMVVKNMPKLPSDKQYQLWALIGSKPVDLGLFDLPQSNNIILKMKNTQRADAFAITVERRGNTDGPDLAQLQAMGKAKL